MKTIEEKLHLIGFKNFIHLRKEDRDGNERLQFVGYYKDTIISIRVVKIEHDIWAIEFIDDHELISSLFKSDGGKISINDIILFFEKYYFTETYNQ